MKAPDKIYIYREPPKDYFEDEWVESKADDVESVPYIRKDALLEWAKEIAENASWVSIDAVVNKIESL